MQSEKQEIKRHESLPVLANNAANQGESVESKSALIQNSSHETYITTAQFQKVVDYACILQKIELEREGNMQKTLEALAQFNPQRGVPLSLVSQVIDDFMHVGKPYVEKALALYFPSKEQVEMDLQMVKAEPTEDYIKKEYFWGIQRAFAEKMPGINLDIPRNFWGKLEILEDGREKWQLGPFKFSYSVVKRIPLAYLSNPFNFTLKFELLNPMFLRVCGEEFERLNERYKKIASVQFSYNYPKGS